MKPDGQIVSIAGYDGREQPPSADIIELLNRNSEMLAPVDCIKRRVTPPGSNTKTDAITVALDHRDSYSVVMSFPYSLSRGTVSIGELFSEQGEHEIFRR